MNFVDSAGGVTSNSANEGSSDSGEPTVLPVKLIRGDGEKTCFAYVEAKASFVVGGSSSGDHTTNPPEPADFYTSPRDGVKDGDMLYWKLEDKKWVLLEAPTASSDTIFVLSHNGTEPSWIETEECDTTSSYGSASP